LGLYVLIDWHVLTPGNPNDASYDHRWDFWGYFSNSLASKKHVLYEICNEPNGVNWS
jgi:aryl-phospho-beta-D-glucosidase BglC (GH1 family)